MLGIGLTTDAKVLNANFGSFVSDMVSSYGYLLLFLCLTAYVVMNGVQQGIEKIAKILMPLLFILMVILIIRGVTLPGGWAGVEFLFTPRWEDFNGTALFNAMGFCFFSLSLGAGTMITYGSYLNPKADLPSSVGWVAFLAILSSILGGLMVMPAVFAFHLDPTAGPGLTFVTMPAVFSQMPRARLCRSLLRLSDGCRLDEFRIHARSLHSSPYSGGQYFAQERDSAHARGLRHRGLCRQHVVRSLG